MTDSEEVLPGGGRTLVTRVGDVVHRQTGPWAPAVHALLRHLEAVGFAAAPRVVGSGFDAQGRETLSFLPGASLHPGPWPTDALANLGRLGQSAKRPRWSRCPPKTPVTTAEQSSSRVQRFRIRHSNHRRAVLRRCSLAQTRRR